MLRSKVSFWSCCLVLVAGLTTPNQLCGQVEPIFGSIGMDSQFVFPHVSLPGATGIDFSMAGGFAPSYPTGESHTVVVVFEWGPRAIGPWTTSPDFVNTVPGGMTDLYATGIFPGPMDAPFVALHFYAGALMTFSGDFSHISVVPEPAIHVILSCFAGIPLVCRRRRAANEKNGGYASSEWRLFR